jgi:cold shock CspA family protein
MRHLGTIVSWDAGRGFGLIHWHGGGDPVFVEIMAFPAGQRRPAIGDVVSYDPGEDERGRPIASQVRFERAASATPPRPARASNAPAVTAAPNDDALPSFAREPRQATFMRRWFGKSHDTGG